MNDSVRGIVAIVAVGLVSAAAGAVAGRISGSRELLRPWQLPPPVAIQGSQPARQDVAATDDSGGRRQADGDGRRDTRAAASISQLPDEPTPQQSTTADAGVPLAPPSDALERRAASFVTAQISGWSSANASDLASLANTYADEILYYGSRKSRQAVLLDKRRLLERWPERTYQVQPGSITVQCQESVCKVRGLMDWQARSAPRASSAKGTAQFEYEVAVSGEAFSIRGETSSVVKRDRQADRQ
jgi:hypothetical protein